MSAEPRQVVFVGNQPHVIVDGAAYPVSGTSSALVATELKSGHGARQKSLKEAHLEFLSAKKAAPESARKADSKPAPVARSREVDPNAVHRKFPARWKAYIRAHYSDLRQVTKAFGVSERTARKWWNGETGANGGHVAVAVMLHPVQTQQFLFAAE